jgi:hypothetical protein
MTRHKHPFCLYSAILLIGLCSCDLEGSSESLELRSDELDPNEPITDQVSVDPLESDFDGDGYADLAIGVPNKEVDGEDAGSVHVFYGTDDGIDTDGDEVWNRDKSGIKETPEDGDEFGYALATGDFDDDGYADLAIGVPSDEVDGVERAGSVTIIYGSDSGLDSDDSQIWSQNSSGISDDADVDDNFGYALTTGDFDNDGYDDLAIGVPGEDVSGETDAGVVHIIYGSNDGLDKDGDQIWHQGKDNVTGLLEDDDRFGSALAAGDFDDNGHDDLAIGVPGEDLENKDDAGWVHVLYGDPNGGSAPGTSDGLSAHDSDVWHQDIKNIEGEAEKDDEFGYALAAGDFDDDGKDDLAIGVPGEDVGSNDEDAGAVNVIYGDHDGLTTTDDQYWHQGKSGIEGQPDDDERFGEALAAGDFNDDGNDDLAVGAPGEDYKNEEEAGQVQVLYGKGNGGLSGDDDQRWTQSTDDIEGKAESHDRFGYALTTGDYDDDGAADLVIGVPFEDVGSKDDAGAINVIYGSEDDDGLTDEDNQFLHQDENGVEGSSKSDDNFGFAVR